MCCRSCGATEQCAANRAAGVAGNVFQQDSRHFREAPACRYPDRAREVGSNGLSAAVFPFRQSVPVARQNLQTFETGSVLLTAEDPRTGQKAEVTVENDALRGDQDDLELTFHAYKDGKTQMSPFMPQMRFSMKQEGQVWTLNEISITIHLPLADPEFLKAITRR
jgi:hypothetical protein